MAEFRPEHQLNIDDGGRAFTDDEPWDEYGLSRWVILLDGQPPAEREKFRSVMPAEYRRIFFGDDA